MRIHVIIILSLVLLLGGCSTHQIKESWRPKVEYTMADHGFHAFAIGAQVADYTSTKDALSRGCVEANPVFGEDPSDASLIAGKVASSLLITWVGNNITNHTGRKVWFGTTGLLVGGVAYHNYNLECN